MPLPWFALPFILPAHLDHALIRSKNKMGAIFSRHERIRERIEQWLTIIIQQYYSSAIDYVVKNRYFTFSIGVGLLIISLGI